MAKHNRRALADPTRLKPLDREDKRLVQVVIETPKGSRNKYAFDPRQKVFHLKKVLPAGMSFPYDFGFVPSTKAPDGDPVDVLVLMDEPAFPGCLLKCRLIGVIEGEQFDDKKGKDAKGSKNGNNGNNASSERNDRILAIEQDNHSWADIRTIRDLGNQFLRELEAFFVDYHKLSGKQYRVLAAKGPKAARKLIENGM